MEGEPPRVQPSSAPLQEMSFLDHLEELRWRIIKGLAGVVVGIAVAVIFSEWIMETLLLGPAHNTFIVYEWLGIDAVDLQLQNRRLPGQFFTYWGTLIIVGVIIGSPALFYQFWAFIAPALEPGEKKGTRFTVFNITLLFILGVLFGYTVLTPFALQFFTQFHISEIVRNDFDINAYFSSITMWTLSCGIIFQLPMASYLMTKIGVLTPDVLIKYRKFAIIICFILAAFLTPPDPISQFIIAIPLLLLFQLSIYICKVTYRRRQRAIFGEDAAV